MNAAQTATRNADSTDRTPVLTTARPAGTARPSATTRIGGAARRILNALMRSLANPHV